MKLPSDFFYRHPRLVKMSKMTLVDAVNDLIIDMLRVSNERKNFFVLLDNNAEKSKKQINPNTISLKQQNFWCENYPFFWTTVAYGIKYNRLLHFVLSSMYRSGRFDCKPCSCEPDHHDPQLQ